MVFSNSKKNSNTLQGMRLVAFCIPFEIIIGLSIHCILKTETVK
jgi:hypothetical protein